MNKFIQIKDVANILGVSKMTLRNWDRLGKLVAMRHPFNNYRVYKTEDIENLIDMIESSPEIRIEKKKIVQKLIVKHLE